jgi:preprotein translocase subunit SecF
LITSGTTLTVVTVLLIFGGEVLRGFSFALLVGILIGTYSSIFIAAPIVLDFDKKSKEPVKKP